MRYWVIQVVRGVHYAFGPYQSSGARDNRFNRVRGGEVYRYDSFSDDPTEVIQEFKMEVAK